MHGGWKWKPKAHRSTLPADERGVRKKEFSSCFRAATGDGQGCDHPRKVMSRGVILMDSTCRKYWRAGLACPTVQPLSLPAQTSRLAPAPSDHASPRGIAFDVDHPPHDILRGSVPVPGYDAPGLPLKSLRDPSLSLVALSGIDPSGPVMVEVPLVQNNSTFTPAQALSGRRVGFAERFAGAHEHTIIEHSPSFLRALAILSRAGAQAVPVLAHQGNGPHRTRNEIDELVHEYQLDALVSDSRSAAFHSACWSGYPVLGEPLGDGATLWFYGAQWSRDSLTSLVQGYRSVRDLMDAGGATHSDE